MLGRLWVAGCTLWPGRWGVRASDAQQPVSAAPGAASAGETRALTVMSQRGGCAAWLGHGGDCRAERSTETEWMVWVAWPMGLARRWLDAERVAGCCFVPQVLVGLRRLSPHAVVVVHRGEVYAADTPAPSFCRVLTMIECMRGGYRRRYEARRAASAAAHDERVCQGLLLTGSRRSVLTRDGTARRDAPSRGGCYRHHLYTPFPDGQASLVARKIVARAPR